MIAPSASAAGSASGLAAWRSESGQGSVAESPPPAGQIRPSGRPLPLLNPSLRFDSEARVLVLEFFDKGGEVARTIPPERVLEAYARGRGESRPEPSVLGFGPIKFFERRGMM